MAGAIPVPLMRPPTGVRTLTFSGGVQIDTPSGVAATVARQTNTQGDGLSVPGGYGVWPAATNKVTQSIPGASATTGVTLAGDVAAVLTIPVDATAPFQGSSTKVWLLDNSGGSTNATVEFDGTASAAAHAASVWAHAVTGTATLSIAAAAAVNITGATYAHFQTTATASAGDKLRITSPAGAVVRFTAAQLETGSIATPFIVTNGGTASRTAGRVQLPVAGLFTATQGWCAIRLRMGYTDSASANAQYFAFNWRDDNNNRIGSSWDGSVTNQWSASRFASSGAGTNTIRQTNSFSAGASKTLFSQWTSSLIGISVDGASFTTTANTLIPSLTQTQAELGTFAGSSAHIDGNCLWVITGSGVPTDADAVVINSFGDTVPSLNQIAMLSPGSKPTCLMPCGTADAILLPAYFGGA